MKYNNDMIALATQHYLDTALRMQLVLIQGGEITAQELRDTYRTSAAQPWLGLFASVYTQVVARGGKVIAHLDIPETTYPVVGSGPAMMMNFQCSKVPVTIVNSGTPTWFLLYARTTNVAYNVNGNAVFNVRGTVSDYSGEGDLLVDGPAMTLGQTRKVLDMKFRQRLSV